MNPEELARECPLFRQIDPRDLDALLHCLNAREITPDKHEFIMNHASHRLIGAVLSGSVQMIREDSVGRKSLLAVLPVGSIFGESYSCTQAVRRTLAYQANEKSRILLLDYDHILHACNLVCRFHHRMIENMVELIAQKNLDLVEKIEVLSQGSIRDKILAYLRRQARLQGDSYFTIPIGRTELAEYLCVDRSAMTRELSRMQEEGLVSFQKRQFTLQEAQDSSVGGR